MLIARELTPTALRMLPRTFAPPMPPLAREGIGGLGVLNALRTNGFSAFPARCLADPVIRMPLPWGMLVLATSPQAIGQVLQTGAEAYARLPAGRRILGPIVGRGLLTADGAAWRPRLPVGVIATRPDSAPLFALAPL